MENHCYLIPDSGNPEIIHSDDANVTVNQKHIFIHRQLRSFITSREFPCIGAKASFNKGAYRLGIYENMDGYDSIQGLSYDLYNFLNEQTNIKCDYTSFIACFEKTVILSEEHFEDLLWKALQKLHDIDKQFHDWDSAVSSDPENPGFTFSFGERAYFVVGMHPASSRYSRKFAYPTLVFNAQYQFEKLKREGRFESMKKVIREKDSLINNGTINPNLGDLNEVSGAVQFGTLKKTKEWKCPFQS